MSEITDKLRADDIVAQLRDRADREEDNYFHGGGTRELFPVLREAATEIEALRARVAVLEVFATNIAMWWDAVSSGQWGAEEERFGWTGALDSHGAMLAFAARRALTPVAETPNQELAP